MTKTATKTKAKTSEELIRACRPDDPYWFERHQGETLVQVLAWMSNLMPPGEARGQFLVGIIDAAARLAHVDQPVAAPPKPMRKRAKAGA